MTTPVRNYSVDVVVVGGGGAGLAAAVSAAGTGASVILLEKCDNLGGSTGIAIGSFTTACTPFQKRQGIEDSPEWHDEDMSRFAAHRDKLNNVELRRWLARRSSGTLDWLMSLGLEFYGPSPEPPNRVPRMHNVVPSAKAYIAVLQAKAISLGVRILAKHRASRLIRAPGGPVTGVEAEGPAGLPVRIECRKAAILAAGDYSNGPAVKELFLPQDVAGIEGINPNSTGDGHLLAREAGADLVNMELIYGPELRFISPPRRPFSQLLPANPLLARLLGPLIRLIPKPIFHRMLKRLLVTWQHPETSLLEDGALLINSRGERFVDEAGKPELFVHRQPEKSAWIVLDATLAEKYSAWPHFVSTAPDIAYAYLPDYKRLRPDIYAEAASLEGLAAARGWDARCLCEAVAAYNQAVRGAAPDPYGRARFGPPIEKPPFIALGPVKSWIVTTEGGVRINDRMEALDRSGGPVPGLYAAGSNGMGGIVIWGHGLHIAWALTSGRIAGQNAAATPARGRSLSYEVSA
jgi:succinate dehydrogenase/fumarate reductase flavoprotein subunit